MVEVRLGLALGGRGNLVGSFNNTGIFFIAAPAVDRAGDADGAPADRGARLREKVHCES